MTEPSPRLSPSGRTLTPGTGAALPLSSAFYADLATTVPIADRNGAIVTPFATLEDAYDVATAGDVLLLAATLGSAAYAAQTVDVSLTIQGINAAPEQTQLNGPSPFVQTKCDGFAVNTAQLGLVGLQITALDLNSLASVVALDSCKVGTVTSQASTDNPLYALGCIFSGNVSPVTGLFARTSILKAGLDIAAGGATLIDCTVTGGDVNQTGIGFTVELHATRVQGSLSLEGDAEVLDGSNVGGISSNGLDLFDSLAGALTTVAAAGLRNARATSLNCGGAASVIDSAIGGALTVTADLTLQGGSVAGAITVGGNATIRACSLGGDLTVTGTLTIDDVTYTSAQQQGHTITAGTLVVLGGLNGQAKTLGYTAAAPVSLMLLPAGHPPGIYLVGVESNVRTAASGGSLTPALTFSTPTTGAVSNTQLIFSSLIATGVASLTPRTFESTGATAMVLTYTPAVVTGSPVIDIFASANRIGYS